jgi:polar amino acid transport system substrate-binding protein
MKSLGWGWSLSALLLCACGSIAVGHDAQVREQLTPTGMLRLGALPGPFPSTVRIGKDPATGQFAGVPVDIASELARKLGVPLQIVTYKSVAQLQADAVAGGWDIAFMVLERERENIVAYGPVYLLIESTYLVPPGSKIQTVAEVDRPGVRVVARAGTPQMRQLSKSLANATLVGVDTGEEQLARLRSGDADAMTSGNTYLLIVAAQWPGARVLKGGFSSESVAIVLPKGRPAALAYVTEFLEAAKASGIVRRAFDRIGLKDVSVPPPSSPR